MCGIAERGEPQYADGFRWRRQRVHQAFDPALIDAELQPTHNVGRYDWMQLKLQIKGSQAIVYDADRVPQPDANLFEPEYWRQSGAIVGQAAGRGSTLLLASNYGQAVLRQYLRGGAAARISRDRYFFFGYGRSRPIVEANLLAHMYFLGLPVPRLLCGICKRKGLTYSGALLTERIQDAQPLADRMSDLSSTDPVWPAIGHCLQRFHAAGVYHADLNARNILLDKQDTVWLIDFDRGRLLTPGTHRLKQNLQRLHRSLLKQTAMRDSELEACWRQLMLAYNGSPGTG